MRIGRKDIREAVDRISVMRKALGDDIGLMVDVNQAWEFEDVIERAKALESYNLTWYEEPLTRKPSSVEQPTQEGSYDWNGKLGEVASRICIPLAAGENRKGLYECHELITKA